MKQLFSIFLLLLFSNNVISQDIHSSKEGLYAKDGVLIGNKNELINQCIQGLNVKENTSFEQKYNICECNLNLISKFYTSKQILDFMKNGENPYLAIFKTQNSDIKKEYTDCLEKSIETFDGSENLTVLSKNFKQDFVIACEYNLKTNNNIDQDKVDIQLYCNCIANEFEKVGITFSMIEKFKDENSVEYNEIIQKCINKKGVIKNISEPISSNDILGNNKSQNIPLIRSNKLYKVKLTLGNISKYFIIDSGASDTSISTDLERELILEGIIKKENYLDDGIYKLADGRKIKCKRILMNNIQIGDFFINNVIISVTNNGEDLLLGKSILNKFSKWLIDNKTEKLYLETE